MPHERLVAVSYPVDGEFTRINLDVLGGDATVAFRQQRGEGERREILRRAARCARSWASAESARPPPA
jgi:hypothetical protein